MPRQPIATQQASWAAVGRPEQPLPPRQSQVKRSILSLLQSTARVHRTCAKHRAIVKGTTADASLAPDLYQRSLGKQPHACSKTAFCIKTGSVKLLSFCDPMPSLVEFWQAARRTRVWSLDDSCIS